MMTRRSHPTTDRPGYVLIAVLMAVVVLSLAAYRYTDAMTGEYTVAVRTTEAAQVKAFAASGVHYAMGKLADPAGAPASSADDQATWAGVAVGAVDGNAGSSRGGGMFSLIYPGDAGSGAGSSRYTPKYGVSDEGAKLNLNALAQDSKQTRLHDALMKLPNMTEEIADAIGDYVDTDDTPRAAGAESAYYLGLTPPRSAKNGPLNSLDELLYVRGVTAQLLYGPDRNRNGRLDPDEDATADFSPGWSNFLTVHGREVNVDAAGGPRVYLNDPDTDGKTLLAKLVPTLGQEAADYVVAARLWGTSSASDTKAKSTTETKVTASSTAKGGIKLGVKSTTTTSAGGSPAGTAADLRAAVQAAVDKKTRLKSKVKTVLGLADTKVTLPVPKGAPKDTAAKTVAGPLNDVAKRKELLPKLLDAVTTSEDFEMLPRLNVTTAPREVLLGLPGLTEAEVDAIISARGSLTAGDVATTTGAWLVTAANLTPAKFAAIESMVTGKSMVYRVHSVGYFARGKAQARAEAVIDTNMGHPRILYYRDVSDLGTGFDLPR